MPCCVWRASACVRVHWCVCACACHHCDSCKREKRRSRPATAAARCERAPPCSHIQKHCCCCCCCANGFLTIKYSTRLDGAPISAVRRLARAPSLRPPNSRCILNQAGASVRPARARLSPGTQSARVRTEWRSCGKSSNSLEEQKPAAAVVAAARAAPAVAPAHCFVSGRQRPRSEEKKGDERLL